jgi:hypothetical protein
MGDTTSHKDVSLVYFNTLRINQSDSRKLHAEEVRSDAVQKGCFSGAIVCPVENVLGQMPLIPCSGYSDLRPEWQHGQYNSSLLQE